MKKLSIFIIFLSLTYAQAQKVSFERTKFLKDKRESVVAEFDVPAKMMTNIVKDFFASEGLPKPGKKSGYLLYEKSLYNAVATEMLDIYVGVSGKKDRSKVTVMASKGYDNFLSSQDSDVYTKFNDVFQRLNVIAQKEYSESKKADQKKVLGKVEKKYNKLVKEGKSLAKEKEKIENRIVKNTKAQEGLAKELEREREKLESIK